MSESVITPNSANYYVGLNFDDNSTAKDALYWKTIGTSLLFTYTIQSGVNDTDGIGIGRVAPPKIVNVEQMTDLAGNVADPYYTQAPANSGYKVDTTPPTASVSDNIGGSVSTGAGAPITFTFTFSDAVTSFSAGNILGLTNFTTTAFTDVNTSTHLQWKVAGYFTVAGTRTVSVTNLPDLAGNAIVSSIDTQGVL